MSVPSRLKSVLALAALMLASGVAAFASRPHQSGELIEIGIGIQNTTTNTVTGGIVLQQLKLLEKHLPRTGKYKNVRYSLSWQNSSSAPPITNGMMANKIQIGMMGDYPLLVNAATGQRTQNETQLVAVIAYNAYGGGNGIVVPADSPYYELSDLRGKNVSVPFGSAAHGMMLQALQDRGLPANFWHLVSQTPEVGSTNLQEHRIDAHGDFVPFAELLPFRGYARKIFDGAETRRPTLHGVVVRKDFGEQYPEIVVAYIKALMEANDWFRKDPKTAAEQVGAWTGIDKEVVYMFLGPGGVHTLDPTIKPQWLEALAFNYEALKKQNVLQQLNLQSWINDRYVRLAYAELGLDYDRELKKLSGYPIEGDDPVCHVRIADPARAGQIWIADGAIEHFSSPTCTLSAIKQYTREGKKIGAAYVIDRALGIQLFADKAFYALGDGDAGQLEIVPFLLKRDAQDYASKHQAKVASYTEVLSAPLEASH